MPGGLMDGLSGGQMTPEEIMRLKQADMQAGQFRPRFAPQGSGGRLNPYEPGPGQEAGLMEALGVMAPYLTPLMRGAPAMRGVVAPYGTPGNQMQVPASVAGDVSGAAINGTIAEMRRLVPNPPPIPKNSPAVLPQVQPRSPVYTPMEVGNVRQASQPEIMDALRMIINGR